MLVSFAGCEDFLQPNPQTIETTNNFYKSNDHFVQAVSGAYARLQDWTLQAYIFEEMRSDNTTMDNQLDHGALALSGAGGIDRFTTGERTTLHEQAWDLLYRGIKDVNEPLFYVENGIGNGNLDPDLGMRLEGELKFLRAYFYFTIVRLWGNVPLILDPIRSGLEAFEIKQSSEEEIFEVIIRDLIRAVSVLPDNYSGSDMGRVTNGAAQTLLAKVYLWKGEHVKAEEILRKVISSGKYNLLSNYADVFDPGNKFHSESIFEVQFREGSEGESSNFMFQFAPVQSYPDIIPVEVGSWGRNLPTKDIVNSYQKGDLRRNISIGFFYREQDDSNVAYVKKWHLATNTDFPRQNYNWPLLRYADVLLMLAEAINKQGYRSGESFDLLNQVRNRANLPSLTPSDLSDQNAFKEALLHERRIELAFENHRWFDLIRFSVAVETMIDHGQSEINNPTTPINPVFPLTDNVYKVEPYMLLYPIPESELIVNPNMKQNEGY
jgi:hypothetical protein